MVALVSAKGKPITRQLFAAQRGFCAGCGCKMPPIGDPCLLQHVPSIDHVEARARGGADNISNMTLMHAICNSRKGDRPPTGCERIWHHAVLAALEIHPLDIAWKNEPPPNEAMALALSAALSR